MGVCGKDSNVAALQDLLIYVMKGLSKVALEAGKAGISTADVDKFSCEAIFSTLTNVNFDASRFTKLINEAINHRENMKNALKAKGITKNFGDAANYQIPSNMEDMVKDGEKHGVKDDPSINPDIKSLMETVVYGIKGIAAYADHALILGKSDKKVYDFIYEAFAATLDTHLTLEDWIKIALKTGEINLLAMELLDAGNTETYGHPVPTTVPLGHKKGKAILVSGHDLKDLDLILKQTEGKGINVYTHGEMLPCHGYPNLKKYPHFYGHYGTAWQNQAKEFAQFPGSIIMTTNCIQKPLENYKANIYTTGLVGWPGITHIADKDFTPAINRAIEMPGFAEDEDKGTVMVGFARNTVMSVADKVIEGVKAGKIRHFFLVAGCDGAKPGRNYYTEFVEKVPNDCIVLTLACGKFRFFDKQLGDIGGIPRLLDIGQCNDAYSAIQIAVALSKAFNVGVNELPLSLILSWYEQKAVSILLTLLYLGIKNIHLGPSLPAFLTPNVLNFLVENYNIKPIGTVDADLKEILG
jgi:hydroxylamine reductase